MRGWRQFRIGHAALIAAAPLLAFAGPFWIDTPPQEWSDEQIAELLTASPWAQMVPGPGRLGNFPAVQVFIATAGPIRQAEMEKQRRARLKRPPGEPPEDDPFAEEYRLWLEEFSSTQIILAIRVANTEVYSNAAEVQRLEEDSFLRAGRKKIPMTGYFPPTARDPFLRLAFPRQVSEGDREIQFDLYIPGVAGPYRSAGFKLEPMAIGGKLEL
jgi:hypothetical protein